MIPIPDIVADDISGEDDESYSAYVLLMFIRNAEKSILKELSPEQQKEFLAGRLQRTPPRFLIAVSCCCGTKVVRTG
jgi:hypothetical protein